MRKVIYIAGRYSDGGRLTIAEQKENARKFRKAQEKLLKDGFAPINPIEMDWRLYREHKINYDDVLDVDIAILNKCDGAYFLSGWEQGAGAQREHQFCVDNNIDIVYQSCDHPTIKEICNDCGEIKTWES